MGVMKTRATMNKPFFAKRSGYTAQASENGNSAEITMYGDVVSRRPVDYWTGEKVEGDFIVQSEILEDLKALSGCKSLEIKLHSLGGECNVAIIIHNKLREMAKGGTKISCTVDGVAMSAGSHIMCAADTVRASEGSLIMIHKSAGFYFGRMNADELREEARCCDAYDSAIVAAYKRKTGKSENELLEMMSAETYMTGAEALEKGFVDELIETGEKVEIAATADKSALVVGGRLMRLYGAACPDNLPVAKQYLTEKTEPPELSSGVLDTKNKHNEGGKPMAKNLNELRAENPELAAAVEKELLAEYSAGAHESMEKASKEAAEKAVQEERKRLEEIEAISSQVGKELLHEAKYTKPCSAQELAYRAMQDRAKKGGEFLNKWNEDYHDSGAEDVSAAAAPPDNGSNDDDPETVKAAAKSAVAEYFNIKEGK